MNGSLTEYINILSLLFLYISDLTKVHIKDSKGNLLFTIREKPTTTYGSLGEEHHGNV